MIIEQIKAQLDRLVPVHRVRDLTVEGPHIERELALVKVKGSGDKRVEALRLADVFRAKVIDAKTDSFVFERSEEHTSELQSLRHLVCRLLLEKKKQKNKTYNSTHATIYVRHS